MLTVHIWRHTSIYLCTTMSRWGSSVPRCTATAVAPLHPLKLLTVNRQVSQLGLEIHIVILPSIIAISVVTGTKNATLFVPLVLLLMCRPLVSVINTVEVVHCSVASCRVERISECTHFTRTWASSAGRRSVCLDVIVVVEQLVCVVVVVVG